jgi:hypothetical protein
MSPASATTFKPDDAVVCVEAHCSPALPGGGVCLYESEWRGDDAVVLALPHLFRLKSAPRSTWPSPFDSAVAANDENSRRQREADQARRLEQARANRVKLDAPTKRYKLTRDLVTERDGRPAMVEKGSVVLEGDPLLAEFPDAFKPA